MIWCENCLRKWFLFLFQFFWFVYTFFVFFFLILKGKKKVHILKIDFVNKHLFSILFRLHGILHIDNWSKSSLKYISHTRLVFRILEYTQSSTWANSILFILCFSFRLAVRISCNVLSLLSLRSFQLTLYVLCPGELVLLCFSPCHFIYFLLTLTHIKWIKLL